HRYGRSPDDLFNRGRHLGGHLRASSGSASLLARHRQYVADDGSVDPHRGRCATADSCLEHCAVGERISSYEVSGRGNSNVARVGCMYLYCSQTHLTPLSHTTYVHSQHRNHTRSNLYYNYNQLVP